MDNKSYGRICDKKECLLSDNREYYQEFSDGKSAKLFITNPEKLVCQRIKIDNCVITDNSKCKCDNMLLAYNEKYISHAFEQLLSAYDFLQEKLKIDSMTTTKTYAIVCSYKSAPKIPSAAEFEFRKKHIEFRNIYHSYSNNLKYKEFVLGS